MITHRRMMFVVYLATFVLLIALMIRIDDWLTSPLVADAPGWVVSVHSICTQFIFQSVDLRQESNMLFRFLFPLIIIMAILSCISIGLLLLVVVNMRLFSQLKIRRYNYYTNKAQKYILQYIDNGNEVAVSELKRIPPKIVTDQIILLFNSIIGKKALLLKKLFYELNCHKFVLSRAGSFLWCNRLRYLPVASAMQITEAKEYARKTIDCYMPLVRNEAEMAYFNLEGDHSMEFLRGFTRVLSEWHQLHFYNLMVRKSIPPPDFSTFFQEKNASVVAFALHMTRLFRQKENGLLVIPYLQHKNESVRKQAILALRDLEVKEAIPDLIDLYNREESRLKVEIIRVLGFLRTDDAMEFLISEMATTDVLIRIEILRSLDYSHRSLLLNNIDNFEGLEEIVKHVSDNRIA